MLRFKVERENESAQGRKPSRHIATGPRIVMKAAGEVVPQTLSSALTCFLRGLLTLPS
jgi:hypothetical protein